MLNKKAQGISMTYIVIAALALIVLIVIVLFFTGGMETLFKKVTKTTEESGDEKVIWISKCKLFCTTEKNEKGDCPNFCNTEFGRGEDKWSCSDSVEGIRSLGVDCGSEITNSYDEHSGVITISLNPEKRGEKRCVC